MNLGFIASAPYQEWAGWTSWHDLAARWFVGTFFQLKAYLVFALLFGYGLAVMASRDADGRLHRRYMRRMAGLLVLGVAQTAFFFVGDILVSYAVIGAALFAARGWGARRLVPVAVAFHVLCLLVTLLLAAAVWNAAPGDPGQGARSAVYAHGSFLDVAAQRLEDAPATLAFVIATQWPGVAAAFCVGVPGGPH